MREFAVVTTFNQEGYELYGKQMIQTFLKHWPKQVQLHVYTECCWPEERAENLHYVNLAEACPKLIEFKRRHARNPKAKGELKLGVTPKGKILGLGFRWNAIRFAHKVYALVHAGQSVQTDVLFWVDGDTRSFADIPIEFLDQLVPQSTYSCYLGRRGKYTECGFVGYNCCHPMHEQFMQAFQRLYDSDQLFNQPEWHDSFLYDVLRVQFEQRGMLNNNLSAHMDIKEGHPFINSTLGTYMDHLKGDRKALGKSKRSDLLSARQEDYWKST